VTDISKCDNTDCPSHQECWRYLAPGNEYWQAYAPFEPKDGEIKCDCFIDAKEWTSKS
jgi:hypothetical protein